MLINIAMGLTVIWVLGLISRFTMGGSIHVLFVVAVVLVAIEFIQAWRTRRGEFSTTIS